MSTESEQEAIDRIVASLPPLTRERRDGLVALFHQVQHRVTHDSKPTTGGSDVQTATTTGGSDV
jgi:hypothetical protein